MSGPAPADAGASWRARAKGVRTPAASHYAGRYRRCSVDGPAFVTTNPATGEPLQTYASGSAEEVDAAVVAARDAYQRVWRRLAPAARKRTLLEVCAAVEARAAEFALFDCMEMGKPISRALADVDASVSFLRYCAEMADKLVGDVAPTDPARGFTLGVREPWGVVGAIVPWNFPLPAACVAVGPALAAGNAVVLKPSEISPSSALHLAEVATEAGLPPGVLNVVAGLGHTAGAALAAHPQVDKLHFTGSASTGRSILESAARSNGKPVLLELGGKSPQIVFSDAADIPGLADAIAAAAFFNGGQVCVARSRLLVEESIAQTLLPRVRAAMAVYAGGDPLDPAVTCGPLASRSQRLRVESFLTEARESGLGVEGAGAAVRRPEGCFLDPVIVTGASPGMRIAREEIFGPVLVALTFRGFDEAIALANDTPYGLAATAWTRDFTRVPRLARDLDAGRIEIRASCAPAASLELFAAEPFRGSGHGALGGARGLDPYLRHKAVELIGA